MDRKKAALTTQDRQKHHDQVKWSERLRYRRQGDISQWRLLKQEYVRIVAMLRRERRREREEDFNTIRKRKENRTTTLR